MTYYHRRRAGIMLVLIVVGTAVMGLTVWATTPPAASAQIGVLDAPTPNMTTARVTTPSSVVAAPVRPTVTVPACTPAPLAERAARTLIVGLPGVTLPSDPLIKEILDLGVGGVFLNTDNVKSKTQVTTLILGIRAQAGRPLLISTDEEPGRVSVFRELVGSSPSARRLAAEETPAGPANTPRWSPPSWPPWESTWTWPRWPTSTPDRRRG